MKILHIAQIRNNPFNGVCVAVPAHILHQSKLADVALLNIVENSIKGVNKQFFYTGDDWCKDVSEEFAAPDIVVFHEVYHIQFAKIAKSLRKKKIPYVIVPHGSLVKGALQKKWLKKMLANLLIFNSFINGASALQVLSNNELVNTAFKPSKFIGTNGVDISEKYKTSFSAGKITITYIGRLQWYVKGLDLLIEAAKMLHDFLIEHHVQFCIYGPDKLGWLSQIQCMIKEAGIEDLFVIHGAVMAEKKMSILMNADIFIQTSRHEGMPMGILEALSLGIPCLITVGTSLGDVVEKYGAGWVAQNDAESISKVLKAAVLERKEWQFKSNNARNLVEKEYSWNIISKNTINRYQKIIENK